MTIHIEQFSMTLWVPSGDVPPPPPTPPQTQTMRFDAGLRAEWYIVPQIDDSNDNLRDKQLKAFVATGKMTAPQFSMYAWGPEANISVTDVEDGINSATGKKALPSTTQVQRTARRQINVTNAMLHTCRLEGVWDGSGIKDRVDEIVYEVASQGIRR